MADETARQYVPWLRCCEKETEQPVSGEIKGEFPSWLNGTLVRVGPGTLNIGEQRFNHIFDGMALLHRFTVQDGQVTYLNKFLKSDTYRKNTEAGRIVVSEFGTRAAPDPCKTIFQRFMSAFSAEQFTDNDLVNIVQYSDEFYAHTETRYIWKIDPETLESQKKVDLANFVPVKMALAHTHEGRDGTVYNVGTVFGSRSGYAIVQFPPKQETTSGAFDRGSVIAKIPFSRFMRPSYYHSFGMTENYIILVEQPLYLSAFGIITSGLTSSSYEDNMTFTSDKVRFHVVRRDSGAVVPIHYTADPFFVFHHINAYEHDGHVVVDMCCYKDASIIKELYARALEENFAKFGGKNMSVVKSVAKRFVLPLEHLVREKGTDENIVKIANCTATAQKHSDGTVHCQPQLLAESEDWMAELPRINYAFNGLKYKYFYGIGRKESSADYSLVKVNVENGSVLEWSEEGTYVSEPVFVADPDSVEEDKGVVVSSVLDRKDDKKIGLLILDAKTMKEMARASFRTESSVPADIHGIFVTK